MPRTCHHGKTKAIAVAVVVTASRAKAQYPWRSRRRFAELGIRTPLAALNRRLLAATAPLRIMRAARMRSPPVMSMAIAARSDDPECPSRGSAARRLDHTRCPDPE